VTDANCGIKCNANLTLMQKNYCSRVQRILYHLKVTLILMLINGECITDVDTDTSSQIWPVAQVHEY